MDRSREANFDGLVGPTHSHAGLSYGNVASEAHAGLGSSPRDAALQGLAKAKALLDLGLLQGVLPPQERPSVAALRALGFDGPTDAAVLARAAAEDPTLLAIASSASAMWTANAATVAPSADTADGRVHLTAANLVSKAHRAVEAVGTERALRAVFRDAARFVVHPALPGGQAFADEGAANHTRLVGADGRALHLFVYGRRALREGEGEPRRYPARQTREASEAIARLHRLDPARVRFVRQSPAAIDRGVFHHDVIGVGHGSLLLVHEEAFADREQVLADLRASVPGLTVLEVQSLEVGLEEAVRSYLFNSQLVQPPGGPLTLIAPRECEEEPSVAAWLEAHVGAGQPIGALQVFDLRQSMRNGGGPACLRLRVPLSPEEVDAVNPSCLLSDAVHASLVGWVERHYRDRLLPADLADPSLLDESRRALDELTQLLDLGSLYPFQRA
ncbi:MAG: N-succinylarginine dihydrolase [Sandaracinaceae bacterium]